MSKTLNRTGKTIIADQVIELVRSDDDELLASVEENADNTAFASSYAIVVSGVFSATKNEPAKVYFNINYNGEPLSKGENGVLFGTSVIVRGTNRDGNSVTTRQYVVGTFEYIEVPIGMVAYNGAQFVLEWTGGINGIQRTLRTNFSIEYGTVTQYAFSSATTEDEIKSQVLEWRYDKPSATESNLTLWSRESSYYDYETGEYTNWQYFKLQEPYLSISPSQSFIQLSSRGVVTKEQTIIFYAISNSSEKPTWYVNDVLIPANSTGTYTINAEGNLVAKIEANNQPISILKIDCTLAGVTATLYMNGTATETPSAGLVTENFNANDAPTVYPTGEPLIDGDFAFGEVSDGTSTFTEVFRYTIDELGNGSWNPVKPDDANYAEIILGCIDYVTNSTDTQKEVKALTGWFKNLFAKRAVIEQIETMGIRLQNGGVIRSANFASSNGEIAGFELDGDSGKATLNGIQANGGTFSHVSIAGEVTTKVLYTQNDEGGLEGGATANSIKAPFAYDRHELYDAVSSTVQKDAQIENRYTGNYGSSDFRNTLYLSSTARTTRRGAINQSVSDDTAHSFTPDHNVRIYNESVPYSKAYTVIDYGYSYSYSNHKNETDAPPATTYPPTQPVNGGTYYVVRNLSIASQYTYRTVTTYVFHNGYVDTYGTPFKTTNWMDIPRDEIPSSYPFNGYSYTTYVYTTDYYPETTYTVTPIVHTYYERWDSSTAYYVTYSSQQTSGSPPYFPKDGDSYQVFDGESVALYYTYDLDTYTYSYSSSNGTKNATVQYSTNGSNWYTFNDPVDVNYGTTFYIRQVEPSPEAGHTEFYWGATTAGSNIAKYTFEPYNEGINFLNASMARVGTIDSSSLISTTAVTVKDGDSIIRKFDGSSSVVGFTLYGRFAGVTPTEGDFTEFTTFTSCRWKEFGKDEVIIPVSEVRRVTWNASSFYVTKSDLSPSTIDQSMWLSSVNISFVPVDTYPAVYTQNIYPFKGGNYKVGDGNQRFSEMHSAKFEGDKAVYHDPNGIRFVNGSKSIILRYDGSHFYVLPSNEITDGNNWTTARPLYISNDGILFSTQINSEGTSNKVWGAVFN